jgi:hypothetical protein
LRFAQSGLYFGLEGAVARQLVDPALRNGISDEDFW